MLSLCYFIDAEIDPMPGMLMPIEWKQVKMTIRQAIEDFDREMIEK